MSRPTTTTPAEVAAMIRALPDADLVALARVLAEREGAPAPAPAAAAAPAAPASGDVDAVVGVLAWRARPSTVAEVTDTIADPDDPWDAMRVRRALGAAVRAGRASMRGRGRYVVAASAPSPEDG